MMSNLTILAQTTLPTDPLEGLRGLFVTGTLIWALISAAIIRQRRLDLLPELPRSRHLTGGLLGGMLLGTACAYVIAELVTVRAMGLSIDQGKTIAGQKLMLTSQPIAQSFAAAFALTLCALTGSVRDVLRWRRPQRSPILSALASYALAIPWVLLSGFAIEWLVNHFGLAVEKQHIIFEMWRTESPGPTSFKTIVFASAIFFAPIAEELFFRGLLQRLIFRLVRLPGLAIVLTSLCFAAIHQPWTLQPPIFILSIALGYAYFRSGNILVPILIHAVFNCLEFALFLSIANPR